MANKRRDEVEGDGVSVIAYTHKEPFSEGIGRDVMRVLSAALLLYLLKDICAIIGTSIGAMVDR